MPIPNSRSNKVHLVSDFSKGGRYGIWAKNERTPIMTLLSHVRSYLRRVGVFEEEDLEGQEVTDPLCMHAGVRNRKLP